MTTENRKLDMSLDDIIRMDGIKGPRRGGGGGFAGNRRRGGPSGGRQFGGDRGRYEPKRLNNGPYNRNRGSFGGHQQNRYQSGGRGGRQMNGFGGGNRRNAILHVANLAPSVNAEDVEELFSTFGALVKSTVHYDQYGTSLGTAEIVFEQRDDAREAKNKLNSVPLDGKPLRISMTDDDGEANDPFSSYLRSSQQREQRNGGGYRNNNRDNYHQNDRNNRNQNNQRQNGGRTGGGRNGGGRKGPPPSVDDLDREMDEWRMQVDDGSGKIDDAEFNI